MMSKFQKISVLLISISIVASIASKAQSLPKNLHFEEEGQRLVLNKQTSSGLYDQSTIKTIHLDFYDTDYWSLMKSYYDTENYVMAKLTYNNEVFDSVGVQFKGQTSYRQAAKQNSEKLSFDIKLDKFIDGQDIDGYSTINLNNAWQDPTFMKEVVYAELASKHIPAVQCNYLQLFLNGENWGLYPNVQQLNNDFIKEWFMNNNGIRWRADVPNSSLPKPPPIAAEPPGGDNPKWGDGTAALNYLGNDTTEYQKYYTLKSSEIENPWSKLVKVCDVLNNTPLENLYDSIQNYINIDATLWFLATEIIFSDDDSYIHKGKMDYCLYFDEETGLMQPMEIDGNSAMGTKNVNWDLFYNEEKVNYPLLNRLLQIPEIRQRYIAHSKTIIEDSFDKTISDELIDRFSTLIDEQVNNDPKKSTTYNQFKIQVNALKQYFTNRKNVISNNAEMQSTSPIITNAKFSVGGEDWMAPNVGEEVLITANATHPSGIQKVNLYYAKGFFGNFEKTEMQQNGSTYSSALNSFDAGDFVRFYVEAVANDAQKTQSYSPAGAEHDVYIFRVNISEVATSSVVINEIMASNKTTATDNFGEYDDWIELYNHSTSNISLNGYYLSDNAQELKKWAFPSEISIDANSYLIVWADNDEDQNGLHTNFKLSASGEELYLMNSTGQIADQVFFTAQNPDVSYGRLPNGIGNFQALEATFMASNQYIASDKLFSKSRVEFVVYPNPTQSFIQFKFNDYIPEKITIFAASGNVCIKTDFCDRIDVSRLSAGLYIIKAGFLSTTFIKVD